MKWKNESRKAYLSRKILNQMNNFLQCGILIPKYPDSTLTWVWGVCDFSNPDGYIQFKELKGQFYGGGIYDVLGYQVKIGEHEFTHPSFAYALRCVYGALMNHGV